MTDSERARPASGASVEAALVARRYYIDDKQKNEIAQELGISRFKVARLLDEARASGIVHISVDMPAELDFSLGDRVATRFGLRRAIVVRAVEQDPESIAALIGKAAADYLASIVGPEDVLGISWGRSLTRTVEAVNTKSGTDVVQLVGGVRAGGSEISGIELVRRLALRTGGTAYPMHAPFLLGSAAMAYELRNDPSLADTISRFSELTIAAVGVGSWEPPKSALFNELTHSERAKLKELGAAADLCAIVVDSEGRDVDSEVIERAVGITMSELRRVPEVVAVAGGQDKVSAISAVLKSGVVNTIVTDSDAASALLAR